MVDILVRKNDGDILSSVLNNGGLMNPKQGSEFLDFIYDQSTLKDIVTTAKFDNQSAVIDIVATDANVVYPMDEGIDIGKRSGISTSKVTMEPFQTMTVIDISDQFLKQNIEGRTFKVLERFGKVIANNIESFNLDADTSGPSLPESSFISGGSATKRLRHTLLKKRNGWMRQADAGHIVDADNSNEMSKILMLAKRAMPSQFKRNLNDLKFITPIDIEDQYQRELSLRSTQKGDSAIQEYMPLKSYGINLVPVPLMSSQPLKAELVTLTGTTPVALRYKYLDSANVWVNRSTLNGSVAEDPYTDTTDYIIDEVNGTIERASGSTMTSGATFLVTYYAPPELILTNPKNLVIAMNTDSIKMEKTRIAVRLVDQYTISMMIDVKIINTDEVVKVINISPDLL